MSHLRIWTKNRRTDKRYIVGIRIFLLISALFLFSLSGIAQEDSAYIGVKTMVKKDRVLLRWAVGTPVAWRHTNKYGFDVERYTVVRNGEVLPQAEMKKLNSVPVKAKPLNEWEKIVQNDDYAAVIAQALYGEEFELSGGEKDIAAIVNMSRELEQRHTVALYAADNSFEAALAAGWAWRDTEVKENERYLYRIVPIIPENGQLNIEHGTAFVAMDEIDGLPMPLGLTGIFGNKSVMLAWEYATFNDTYNSYFVEKSEDGKNYVRLDGIPVTNMNNGEDRPSQRIYFTDSLTDNTKTYHYRVIGVTPFGENGPPSEPISGRGRELFPYFPEITVSEINPAGNMELEWEFDERGNSMIKGFELSRSENASDYETVVEDIKPERRQLLFPKEKLSASNYFSIRAIPYDGDPVSSFPVLVQPVDSIPPAIPVGFRGWVDTAGIVTLTWNANTENDLLGYKLYRSHLKDEEAVPLFDVAWRDTVYHDTVDVKNLNSKVFYYISSVDRRYNQSDPAPVLELDKPDLVPPSSPVISEYKIRDEGIEIGWINSSDTDIKYHRVWRHEKGEGYTPKTLLATMDKPSTTVYVDTSAVAGIHYVYTVTAVKQSGIESSPSNGLTLFTNKSNKQNIGIERFDAVVDKQNRMLKLVWKDKIPDVAHYEIYKGANNEGVTLWKTAEGNLHEVMDETPDLNVSYQYVIRAVLKSGQNTGSKAIVIKF